jgi:methyl-accepting chemotaxis protein
MFPSSFQATVGQRMALWGALLGFLFLIFAAIDLIHMDRVNGFVEASHQVRQDADAAADPAAVLKKLDRLRGDLEYHAANNHQNKLLLSLLAIALISQIVFLEYRWMIRPMIRMADAMAAEKPPIAVLQAAAMRRDEIGVLGKALLAQSRASESRAKASASEVALLTDKIDQQTAFEEAGKAFRAAMSDIATRLEAHAGRMNGESDKLVGLSQGVKSRASAAAGSTGSATLRVDEIAEAASRTADVIARIASEAERTAGVSSSARRAVHDANDDTRRLGEAVQLIEQIMSLIQEIAGQTNLLALNATIEAARAGESGKGFSVVAQEVKQLAQRTAQATSDVRQRLDAVNAASGSIAARIDLLVQSVESVDKAANDISALIREQDGSARIIGSGTAEAATAMRQIAERVEEVAGLAGEAHASADTVTQTAGDLARQSTELRRAVDDFVATTKRIAA